MSQPLTATSYAVLGLLSFGRELSGYELKQDADRTLEFFYRAPSMSQVYRELDRLTEAGLVKARSVNRPGAPPGRVYRLTAQGRRALTKWVESPAPRAELRHHPAFRLFLGHMANPAVLRRQLEDHRQRLVETLASLRAVRASIGDDPNVRHAALVAEWGIELHEGELRGLDQVLDRL